MPVGPLREKVLYGIARKRGRPHRYTILRWVVGLAFTAVVAWLPLSGTLRFDLWSGHHVVLGEHVDFVTAAKAFAFPFLAVNVAIVVASRFLGRYLCGFVCPYGALARLAEWFRFDGRTRAKRALGATLLLTSCMALSAIVFSFWIDARVFIEGSTSAKLLAGAFFLGTTLVLFVSLRRLGLRFCREWCPSGVYFALLGQETWNGIEFAHPETCTDCGACAKVCPMDLEPKDMPGASHRDALGFYPQHLSNFALCIRCGDCINACEGVQHDAAEPLPLRMGWLDERARGELEPVEMQHGG